MNSRVSCFSQAHLALDLLGCVSKEDGRVGVTGTHLGLSTLQGREEGRMQQGRFRVADPGGHVPRHSEVRILGGEDLGEDNGTNGQALANEQPTLKEPPSWEAVKSAVTVSNWLLFSQHFHHFHPPRRVLKPLHFPQAGSGPYLVNGTRDEALDVRPVSEDLRERVAE